jgi:hypothetical protein
MCLRREGHHRRRAGGDPAQRSCRLAGLLPRVRGTSVRDSSQTDGQLSHQAEAASGVAGAPSRCRRGGRQTPGWTTCDSAARWPTSSLPPAIRHVLARGTGTSKRPARTPEVGRVGERRLAPRGLADWCRFPPAPHRSVHAVVPHTAHRRSSPSAFGSLTPRPVRPGRSDGSVQADQSVAVGPGVERVSAVAPRLLMAGCDPQL